MFVYLCPLLVPFAAFVSLAVYFLYVFVSFCCLLLSLSQFLCISKVITTQSLSLSLPVQLHLKMLIYAWWDIHETVSSITLYGS